MLYDQLFLQPQIVSLSEESLAQSQKLLLRP